MLSHVTRSWSRRYLFAFLIMFLAVGVWLALRGMVEERIPSEPLLLILIVVTFIVGVGPAIGALLVSAFSIEYFLLEPYGKLSLMHAGDYVGLGLYLVIGSAIIWVGKRVREEHALLLCEKNRRESTMALLGESEARFRSFAENSTEMFLILRRDGTIEYTNRGWEVLTGRTRSELYADPGLLVDLTFPEDRDLVRASLVTILEHGIAEIKEFRYIRADGSTGWLHVRVDVIRDSQDQPTKAIALAHDVTEGKLHQMERDRLLEQLTSSLEKVKLLSGLIPICAGCKRVRCDSGFWQQVESYIRDHSEAEFTHSFCPECMAKYGWTKEPPYAPSPPEVHR
jgi:PAS domain S-box-containing protein